MRPAHPPSNAAVAVTSADAMMSVLRVEHTPTRTLCLHSGFGRVEPPIDAAKVAGMRAHTFAFSQERTAWSRARARSCITCPATTNPTTLNPRTPHITPCNLGMNPATPQDHVLSCQHVFGKGAPPPCVTCVLAVGACAGKGAFGVLSTHSHPKMGPKDQLAQACFQTL